MIRFQDLPEETKTSVVRFYNDPGAGEMGDFQVVCTITWESPTVVWVHGMMGKGNRTLWREFVQELDDKGVEVIKAKRAEGRRLPMALQMPDGSYEMRIDYLQGRQIDTGFTSL